MNLCWAFDQDVDRLVDFCEKTQIPGAGSSLDLLNRVDAVIITSENAHHKKYALEAIAAGKAILCEKPLATNTTDASEIVTKAREAKVVLMTAFPCRFTPAWAKVKEKVNAGVIGDLVAICATNRGQCPGGWFVDAELSGGGAMIDHTVHVADLLLDLLGEEPSKVSAQVANKIHGEAWEDSALLTLDYPSGVFATLDSSWSRPKSFYTWGDVTMKIVGTEGVIELDMFGQLQHMFGQGGHTSLGFGSDPDRLMLQHFVQAARDKTEPMVTGEQGLAAVRVAELGYQSLLKKFQAV